VDFVSVIVRSEESSWTGRDYVVRGTNQRVLNSLDVLELVVVTRGLKDFDDRIRSESFAQSTVLGRTVRVDKDRLLPIVSDYCVDRMDVDTVSVSWKTE
jgi:hypothetical protein